jgi:hypothetical protein
LNFLTKELRDQVKAELILLKLVQNEEIDSTETPSPKFILLGKENDTSSSNCFQTEVAQFLGEKSISHDNNALEWWKMDASRFPLLAVTARSLLCVPATSTASERLFSTAGLTVSKLRNSLKPENFDALVFLNKNFNLLKL